MLETEKGSPGLGSTSPDGRIYTDGWKFLFTFYRLLPTPPPPQP